MRICTITCQNADNHGARLQAYALAEYLSMQGHEVEVIDYRPDYMTFRTTVGYWPGLSIKMWAKLFLQLPQRIRTIRRHGYFVSFSTKYMPLTHTVYPTVESLRENPPQADLYIAGSDQIWNTDFRNGTDEAYYLNFGAQNTRRISYAASFATKALAEGTEEFVKAQLHGFDSISVREKSGLNILSSLGYEGRSVIDPVFLLSASDWDKIADETQCEEEYILVYDFMESKIIKKIAQRLALIQHCRIYAITHTPLEYADRNFVLAGPEVFLGLIKHAQCVVSNSFHGTAFAIIYRRNFFVVMREDGLNERMKDLLDEIGLSCRLIGNSVSDATLKEDISFCCVEKTLNQRIMESKTYLKENSVNEIKQQHNLYKINETQ